MFPLSTRIAASGLFAQQDRMDAISKNIANKDVEGYKRLNPSFSTVVYNGGVSFSSSANNYPWVDRNLAEKSTDLSRAASINEGLSSLDNLMAHNNVEETYNGFMSASKNLQMFPGSQQHLQEFNSAGQALNDSINQANSGLADIQRIIKNKTDLSKIELDSFKSQLEKITSTGVNETNSNDVGLLQQKIATLSGSIAGYNEFATSVMPSLVSKFGAMTNKLKSDINSAGQVQAFVNGKWIDQTSANNLSINNTDAILDFKNQIGTLNTEIGAATNKSTLDISYYGNQRAQAAKEYDNVYGVSLERETLDMMNAQKMYEANIKVLQVSDKMIGSLLDAMG